MQIDETYECLKEKIPALDIRKNEEMSKHTSFKVGGTADIWIKIKDINELKYILNYSKEKEIPITIMGNGTNLLVKDNGIRGITIQLGMNKIEILEENDKVKVIAESGVKLGMLAMLLQKNEITGFEFASGIPGSIGGAIYMNAGAYGKEMKEIVKSVTYIDEELNIKTLNIEEVNFSYRHSRFKGKNDIIISAELELQKGNIEDIKKQMDLYRISRQEKQPIEFPSAGSTFKRGTNYISAQLIDEAGLKGYSIGSAKVSEKHAGFIINTGNATAKDITDLIEYVIKVVYEKFGKVLETEIEIVGE